MKEQTKKKWLGFFAFAPIIFIVLGFVAIFVTAIIMAGMGVAMEGTFVDSSSASAGMIIVVIAFFLAYGMLLLGVIFGMAQIVVYIIMACKNPDFDSSQKILWSIGIYCFSIFICPVYWTKYLKK